jgi:cytochrome c-type biogenesis protein CcmH
MIDELRCPKCLNTNLSGSDSPIAADLRRSVAEMIREGRSDQQIRDYLVERYGDFILYRPRLTGATFLLWFGPGLLLLVGFAVIWVKVRRQLRRVDETDLSADEAERLARLRNETR